MSPDDPRHGTVAGHIAHQRSGVPYCEACIRAKSSYDKRRKWDALNGRGRTVPSLGARRRLQSLQYVGWSRARVAEAAGWKTTGALNYLMRSDTITRSTHEKLALVFEALAMKQPPDEMAAIRARTWARRRGYAPPLAWDDIDDPNEQPTGVRVEGKRRDLLAEWDDLRAAGESIEHVAHRLGVTAGAIERAEFRAKRKGEAA